MDIFKPDIYKGDNQVSHGLNSSGSTVTKWIMSLALSPWTAHISGVLRGAMMLYQQNWLACGRVVCKSQLASDLYQVLIHSFFLHKIPLMGA